MSNEESRHVVNTWELKGFREDFLGLEFWSPVFRTTAVSNGSSYQWKIGFCAVYRYGQDSDYFFNSCLMSVSNDKPTDEIDCGLSITDCDESKARKTDVTTWNFSNSDCCHFEEVKFSSEDLSDGLSLTFLVCCHIKGMLPFCGESHANTRIEQCSFPWVLENFLQLQPNQKVKLNLVPKNTGKPVITLELYFDESGHFYITVCRCDDNYTGSVTFRLSLFDPLSKKFCNQDSFSFCKDLYNVIMRRDCLFDTSLSMGAITLLVECFFVEVDGQMFPYQELVALKNLEEFSFEEISDKK